MKEPSLAEVLTASTTLAFLLTVAYGKGFSIAVGFSIFNYFTTNDYFRQAVEWSPSVLIAFIGGWFLRMLGPLPIPAQQLHVEPQQNDGAGARRKRLELMGAAGSALVLLGVFVFIPMPNQVLYGAMVIYFVGLWVLMTELYIWERLRKLGWSRLVTLAFTGLPPLLLLTCYKGAFDADIAYRSAANSTSTRVILNGESQLLPGAILLNLDQFLILRDDDNQQIKVIPQSEIKQIIHDN